VANGDVLVNGRVFRIKGVNWFGLETPSAVLLGLDVHSIDYYLDFLVERGVNFIRLPVSVSRTLADSTDLSVSNSVYKTIDSLLAKAAARGILMMLDMHTISPGDNLSTYLWYNSKYSENDFFNAWSKLIGFCKKYWNFVMVDFKNEVIDGTWGTGDLATDWRLASERLVERIETDHPDWKGLYVVQGISNKVNPSCGYKLPYGFWYGGNLVCVAAIPLSASIPRSRLTYSTHVYGPSVYVQPYFNQNLDTVLPEVYEAQHGFVEDATGSPVIVGEWGGTMNVISGIDELKLTKILIDYHKKRCIADAFWWAMNPESTDTGGLFLPDWTTPIELKWTLMAEMQPFPSRVTRSSGTYFLETGAPGHSGCA